VLCNSCPSPISGSTFLFLSTFIASRLCSGKFAPALASDVHRGPLAVVQKLSLATELF
jgi:hypothetical protein